MSESVASYYNKLYRGSESYLKDPITAVKSLPELIDPTSVLDLGAGRGADSLYLASNGFAVTAVDNSKEGLKNIKEAAENLKLKIKIVEANILERSEDGPYGVVLCNNVLNHQDLDVPDTRS